MIDWKITERGFYPEKIAFNGNKFLIANGYMGVRGTLEEFTKDQLVAVNMAGLYDQVGNGWRESVNAPNGFFTYLIVDEEICRLPECEPSEHSVSLDYRNGIFSRKTTWKTPRGSLTVESERFVSLAQPHLALMKYKISSNFHADIELITGIDADVWDINGPHYSNMELFEEDGLIKAIGTTSEKGHKICVTENCSINLPSEKRLSIKDKKILRHFCFILRPEHDCVIEKWISVCTSNDTENYEQKAASLINDYMKSGYKYVKNSHIEKWEERWKVSEVFIEGHKEAMEALNYSIYHLISVAPRHSKSLSIPARGLSGQVYKGAVFWDTEMFMLDFFLYTDPQVARTLIKYRIDTLDGAIRKARYYGYDGAFYAWESQETGDDACSDYNVVDVFTKRPVRTYFKDKQIHISSAIVRGIMRYIEITGDKTILDEGGAETIIECAKFYYSLLLKRLNRNVYELHDVVGPDEYHERVNNNGYTNRMAKYTFDMAVEVLSSVKNLEPETAKRLKNKYKVSQLIKSFTDASKHIYIPQPDKNGIIEQFDGYMKLEDASLEEVRSRLLDEKEYWGGANGVASHTRIIKQADVVTWLAMFPDDFPHEILLANWRYYEPRTEHGSSLSACMYGLLACRCGMPEKALPFFMKSARADLEGTGKEWAGLIYIGGTHPAAAGGAYMTAVNGFGGIYFEEEKLKAKPQLPPNWQKLRFNIYYKGKLHRVEVDQKGGVSVTREP
ncbi:MAG: glycoside hydrolase family 65 protein [Clostridiaceae bacterium]|nr:glycoside hydrolase family 65 protein [Clostridiaceae bacterium]